jgi:hypothetical protein
MHAMHAAAPPLDARSQALVGGWMTFIHRMEDVYDAPVRQTPDELRTAAAWAARLGLQPPALPTPHREAVSVG